MNHAHLHSLVPCILLLEAGHRAVQSPCPYSCKPTSIPICNELELRIDISLWLSFNTMQAIDSQVLL
jgi:hypothetical protein